MALDLFGLTPQDRDAMAQVVEMVMGQIQNQILEQDPMLGRITPEVYIARPHAKIPERTGLIPGFLANVQICKADYATGTISDIPNVKKTILNLYKWPLFHQAHPHIFVRREKFGFWFCERPRSYHYGVVTGAAIEINTSGQVQLDIGETITAHLDRMHSGQKVSVGKQVRVEYIEELTRWRISNGECE